MKPAGRRWPQGHAMASRSSLVLGVLAFQALAPAAVSAQSVAAPGFTGGLSLPSAEVLQSGQVSYSFGSLPEPSLSSASRHRNYTVGIGLAPDVEIFGRLADYSDAGPSGMSSGIRDLSANVKWRLPISADNWPMLAVGATDLSGGATNFRSVYAVASDRIGFLHWNAGWGRSATPLSGNYRLLNGAFLGLELPFGDTGVSALAEAGAQKRQFGLRLQSQAPEWLGQAQLAATWGHSINGRTLTGERVSTNQLQFSVAWNFDTTDAQRIESTSRGAKALPPLKTPTHPLTGDALRDQMDLLALRLEHIGLDRVRVGLRGPTAVVQFENHLYMQHEADAMGVVLGLAVEMLGASVEEVEAQSLKHGLMVSKLTVPAAAYQGFLRDPFSMSLIRDRFKFEAGGGSVAWLNAAPSLPTEWVAGNGQSRTWVGWEIRPLLNHALGTEYGAFDYSLAAQLRATLPLWTGAQAYVDEVIPAAHTSNMDPGGVYAASLHRQGTRTVAVQQSTWLTPWLFTSLGAGTYEYNYRGAQLEAIASLPWNEDSVHWRSERLQRREPVYPYRIQAYSGSYRWHMSAKTWLEAGYNQYTDRTRGPSATLTRWLGDLAVQLSYRRGAADTFIGLTLSLPFAPRQGQGASVLQWNAPQRFDLGVRTLMTSSANTGNFVRPDAVRPVDLSFKAEEVQLDAGRTTALEMANQLQRMRESFFLHARDQLD